MVYLFCAAAALVGMAGALGLRRTSTFGAAGLLLGGAAALAYAGATAGSPWAFKVYYALGAAIFPGMIGAAACYFAFSRRVARWPAAFVLALAVVQIVLTLPAAVVPAALVRLDGGNGAGVLVMGAWVAPTVLFNTFGLGFALVAALFGWWKAFRDQTMDNGALAIGLSVVVLGILARSDGVFQVMAGLGARSAFLLADAVAFGLVWAGFEAVDGLRRPLGQLFGSRPRESAPAQS